MNTTETFGSIKLVSSPDKPEFAIAQYPADKIANDDLKNTFGRENVTFNNDDKFYAVRFTGKTNYDTLKAFAERHSGRLADREQSFKNATAFEAQFKDALRATQSPNKDAKGNDRGWTEGQATDKWYSSKLYESKRKTVNKAQFRHELIKSAYWACKSKSDKLDTLSRQIGPDDLNSIKSTVINGIGVKIRSRKLS